MTVSIFRVDFSTDILSDGTRCVVARDPDHPECYGFGKDDEEAFRRLLRARRVMSLADSPTAELEGDAEPIVAIFGGEGESAADVETVGSVGS